MKFPVWFKNTSILSKFIFIAFLATGVAMLFAILLSTLMQWFMLREELVKTISAQASIIAANSTDKLLLNDREGAKKTVSALANIDSIEFAGILDKSGNNFAHYVRPESVMPPHQHNTVEYERHIHTATYVEIVIPIVSGQERIGIIHVRSSMAPVYEKLGWNMLITVVAAAGAFLTAVLMVLRLLPAITDPLQYLIGLMKRVSQDNDFAIRAKLHGHDEMGTLAKGFNAMLAQIESRDAELARYREHLEEEVALRTDRLTEVHRIAHLGNWEWNIVNNTLSWSDEIYRIFGFTPQQFDATYESFMRSVHPDDRESVETSIREALEGNFYNVDHRIVLPDGTVRHVHEQGKITRDKNSQPVKMLGTVQDITERKQMELKLRESEQRFRNLTELTSDLVWQVDEHGTYVYSGVKVHDLLGYTPEEMYGKTPFDFMPPEEAVRVAEIFKNIVANKIPFSYMENTNLHKDGHRVILETSGVPLFDDKGVFYGYFGTEHDITERKRAEEEIALLATTDSLTGIANRREFNLQLGKEIERAKRYNTPLSLVMYDIDHFKRVNDTFGHDTGDSILQMLTAVVKANIRTVDFIARWGGEEFMILMPQSDEASAGDAAEKLRQKIIRHSFNQIGSLTVSFGVTAFAPNDDSNTFLKRVDTALYKAKENGRNRVEILPNPSLF